MKKPLLISVLVVAGIAVLAAVLVGTGFYNVAADEEHSPLTLRLLATARDRSIAVRAAKIDVPELADPQRVRRGAGNYNSMCASCHLKPGAEETEISRGLYPKPPEFVRSTTADPARAFWVIKHGIKATGMPAWGKSMEDSYIWDMVAFLKQLPQMSAEEYRAEVRASGGHSHGGGETMDQNDEESGEAEHSPNGADHSHDETSDRSSGPTERSMSRTPGSGDPRLATAAAKGPLAVVEAFHAALSSGKAAKIEPLLDPNVLIMEGGNVERSRHEYASHHLPSDLKFMSTIRYELQRQTGDAVGDLAWVATEATLTSDSSGKAVDLVSTESLVLKKSAAGWKIVHIHWSSRSAKKA
jgi:mono/diheme cytochrome c family protein